MILKRRMKRCCLMGLVTAVVCFADSGDAPVQHQFEPLVEEMPAEPWHTHFVDEAEATPEGHLNGGAAGLNNFLRACLEDRLERTAAGKPWREYAKFLGWAVWGYLSPDSEYQGDERLLEMSREWMDRLFVDLRTKPEDPERAEKWRPDSLGTWSFGDYSAPMLEIEVRPELADKLGEERVARYRALLLHNIERYTTPESWNRLLERAQPYINIATHPMAIYVHGWLLTGEEKYWRMAASLVAILARDQLPNGMFPYRYHIYGEQHVEFEGMYYHAINIRALYMYWWATGSDVAKRVFEESVPYYPLNMEPPYHFNDGPAIWWKNIWRTFWPQHIAMVAAVTGDGENAKLALDMARDNISRDRIDLLLGAHAYRQLALKDVEPVPVRDGYIIRDPDIRGVRLRFSPWSSTFTTSSFTYTRVSAMLVEDGLNALHMARPYLRVKPLEKKPKYEQDYGTLSRHGAAYSAALAATAGAVATRYQLASTAQTWRETQALAPFDMTELWIMTDNGMIGVIDSRATEAFEVFELNHQFRFIVGKRASGEKTGERQWRAVGLSFRVWDTNFPHAIEERTRRYAMAGKGRADWQVSLADMDRLPEHIAQDGRPPPTKPTVDPTGETDPEALDVLDKLKEATTENEKKLPVRHTIPKGYSRFSVVEVSPASTGFNDVARLPHDTLVALQGTTVSGTWTAVYNPTEAPQPWKISDESLVVARSWSETTVDADQKSMEVPPAGVMLLKPD